MTASRTPLPADGVPATTIATAAVRHFRETPEDIAAVRALLETGIAAGEMPDMTLQLVQPVLDQAAMQPESAYLALDDGQAIVGLYFTEFPLLLVAPSARRRGHGRRLVTTALTEAADPHTLELQPPLGSTVAEAFARSLGFEYRFSYWQLCLPSDVALPAPQWPSGYTQRTFRPGEDDAAYSACVTASFAAHHPPIVMTPELLTRAHAQPDFSADNIAVIVPDADPTQIVAFARVVRSADEEAEVRTIGVLPQQRGLGLGRELLRWSVQRLREQGAGVVTLSVEGRNANALALYLRHDFRHDLEWPHWALPPGAAVPTLGG